MPGRRVAFGLLMGGMLVCVVCPALITAGGNEAFAPVPVLAAAAMIWRWWQLDGAELSISDTAILLFLSALATIPSQQLPWLVILLAAAWLSGRAGAARAPLSVLIACALVTPATGYALRGFGAYLLAFDAWVTAGLLKLVTGSGEHQGNLVTGPSEHALVILYGCSSVKNLGSACIVWWAASVWTATALGRSHLLVPLAISAAMVALNALRLFLMALDVGWHRWWHAGLGVQTYDLLSAAIPIAAVLWTVRRADRA